MKKICFFVLVLLSLFLNSCWKDTTKHAKDEFSKYYNGKNEVILNIDDKLYFENYILDLSALVDGHEYNNGLIINQQSFIFSTSKENSKFNFTFNIYESNLQGTDIKMLYSQDGFKTHPWAYAIDGVFYIEHYSNHALDPKSKLIDKYTISAETYENVDGGEDCGLSNYLQNKENSRYNIEVIKNVSTQEHGKFIVTNLETGISRTIDDDFLNSTF